MSQRCESPEPEPSGATARGPYCAPPATERPHRCWRAARDRRKFATARRIRRSRRFRLIRGYVAPRGGPRVSGFGRVTGRTWGYLADIAVATISILDNFLFAPIEPFWALVIIASDVLVIRALARQLAAQWTRRPATPAFPRECRGRDVSAWHVRGPQRVSRQAQ
ncbi:DUF7144 family membrane protein [Nocardia brasiliensis]|uniref:DUF7144 family membrane protein n=1 Tax=Nocardia brasiliensis TaxID=37326 RepID=UPI003D17E953